MIELFLEIPTDLKIIILAGLTLIIYEFLKGEVSSWKKRKSKTH